ncbi:MAG: hypothetical protein ABF665_15200 [Gluconacetobacter sp.]
MKLTNGRRLFCVIFIMTMLSTGKQNSFASPIQDNPQITNIFQADQDERTTLLHGKATAADWAKLAKRDEARRATLNTLMKHGALHSAADYAHAAMVYQHAETSDGYLLAHCLAMTAVSLGDENARWLEAATLDRYLQEIGQPQIFGTQFTAAPGKDVTQAPYNRALLTDENRAAFNVPSLAAQELKRKTLKPF